TWTTTSPPPARSRRPRPRGRVPGPPAGRRRTALSFSRRRLEILQLLPDTVSPLADVAVVLVDGLWGVAEQVGPGLHGLASHEPSGRKRVAIRVGCQPRHSKAVSQLVEEALHRPLRVPSSLTVREQESVWPARHGRPNHF